MLKGVSVELSYLVVSEKAGSGSTHGALVNSNTEHYMDCYPGDLDQDVGR